MTDDLSPLHKLRVVQLSIQFVNLHTDTEDYNLQIIVKQQIVSTELNGCLDYIPVNSPYSAQLVSITLFRMFLRHSYT